MILSGANSSDMKSRNISAILLTLLFHQDVSRVHLAQRLGVSSATITNLVTELTQQGHIVENGFVETNGQVGRRQRVLRLVPDSRFALGVHVDVGVVYIALTDITGSVLDSDSFTHDLRDSWQSVLDRVLVTIDLLLQRQQHTHNRIVGIGVAASGLVNAETGVNVYAPNLGWHDVPIQHYLQRQLDYPITVENNVRAMAFAEAMFGCARSVNALAFLYGRVGVGAGLVVDRQLYRGASAGAGEIGHAIFVFDDGVPQPLESLVSESAIRTLAEDITGERLSLTAIIDLAKDGHAALRSMWETRAFYVGLALANIINIFNPEMIVLGGIFYQAKDLMLEKIQDTVRRYAFANLGERVSIQTSHFGRSAGMVGAAALALDAFFYRSRGLGQAV
ncbi:MAG: ROK family transcriptional regulator [Anaerolineae bacterium]